MTFLPGDIVEVNTPGKITPYIGNNLHGFLGVVIETDFWGRVFVQFKDHPQDEDNIWDFIPEELILIDREVDATETV